MKNTDELQNKKPVKFRNRDDAMNQVCKAFVALGKLAGIDVDKDKIPDSIDADLVQAARESYFDDPHFLGGPACFHYAETTDDVDDIAGKANTVTQGFSQYIHKNCNQKNLQQAEAHIALIDAAIAWLRKTRRSP